MEKKNTYFIDIDGTVFKYKPFNEIAGSKPEVIESVAEKIRQWFSEGHHIVFTTARPQTYIALTKKQLTQANIPFNQIVMGIERGPRYLINDMDPNVSGQRAIGINLIRDLGFVEEKIPQNENTIEIVSKEEPKPTPKPKSTTTRKTTRKTTKK